jgi:hypothetical protein
MSNLRNIEISKLRARQLARIRIKNKLYAGRQRCANLNQPKSATKLDYQYGETAA